MADTVVCRVRGPLSRSEASAHCAQLELLVARTRARCVVCELCAVEADGAALDALASLALTARRLGTELLLRGVSRELGELIGFAGLAAVLRVESRREPEQRE